MHTLPFDTVADQVADAALERVIGGLARAGLFVLGCWLVGAALDAYLERRTATPSRPAPRRAAPQVVCVRCRRDASDDDHRCPGDDAPPPSDA